MAWPLTAALVDGNFDLCGYSCEMTLLSEARMFPIQYNCLDMLAANIMTGVTAGSLAHSAESLSLCLERRTASTDMGGALGCLTAALIGATRSRQLL